MLMKNHSIAPAKVNDNLLANQNMILFIFFKGKVKKVENILKINSIPLKFPFNFHIFLQMNLRQFLLKFLETYFISPPIFFYFNQFKRIRADFYNFLTRFFCRC